MTNLDADFLTANAEMYNCFACTNSIQPAKNNYLQIKSFFERNGVDFYFNSSDFDNIRFFYFGIAGYCPSYDLHWLIITVSSTNGRDIITEDVLLFFAKDSLEIDMALREWFELMPAPRFSAPIKNPKGTMEELAEDGGVWFAQFQDVYVIETREQLKRANKAVRAAKKSTAAKKKVVDKKKKVD